MKNVRILRVDPERQTIATMHLKRANDATPQLRKLIRAKNLGSRQIMTINDASLMSIAQSDIDEGAPGWRLPGLDDTAGVTILSGMDKVTRNLISVPVDRDWLLKRIIWLGGESQEERTGRAEEVISLCDADVRQAIADAIPIPPDGEMWLTAAHKQIVGPAMVALGLGTERSGGQMLTGLGIDIHDMLMARK